MITVLVTGGFDPIHSGHISYLKSASYEGTRLVVGVNSDAWLERKKGRSFMSWIERSTIIQNLKYVDEVIAFDDDDDSAIDAIRIVKEKYPNDHIVFANGGDRTQKNIPEMVFDDVEFIFGIGGEDKKNSSSQILKRWDENLTTIRTWGSYQVLNRNDRWLVKKLNFGVGRSLSDQKHFHRSEHWHVVEGHIRMELEWSNGDKLQMVYGPGDSIDIPAKVWHRATNVGGVPAKVIEVWLLVGEDGELTEEDIVRRDRYKLISRK